MLRDNPYKPIIYWLLSGCAIVYVMVVVGCLTRLTHSGLSITDWSFMGQLPPFGEEQWMERFAKYQESPEFIYKNSSMNLDEFKSIFWWEWTHRFIGRTLLGGVFCIGFLWFLMRKKLNKTLILKFSFLFLLGAAQGLIGWWMVKSGLIDNPAVSHYRLAIHLMSAFTVFAFTFWFALQLIYYKPISENNGAPLKKIAYLLFGVLILQIVYGAFVAGLKAGLFYPTWPKMGDEWFPEETILVNHNFVQDFMENGAGVQFMHRTIALLVVGCVAWLWIKSNKLKLNRPQYLAMTLLIYGVTLQFILGVLTLLYQVPVWMGALHQTGAFFLFATTIFLLYHLHKKPVQN